VGTPNPPNTSGTYSFAPGLGECTAYAYGLCGIRRTALTQSHFEDARMATNMVMGRASADGVNLWQVDLVTVPLVQGRSTYEVPNNTIVILDVYYSLTNGGGSATRDRILTSISRSEWASYPNKEQQGQATVYWFDRLLAPTITIWPVPPGTPSACLKYYRLRQTQDSNFANGQQVEIPTYFLEWFTFALALRLAAIWAPDRAPGLKAMTDESWSIVERQNRETSNIYFSPAIEGYFR
jgi:hypothetical protein